MSEELVGKMLLLVGSSERVIVEEPDVKMTVELNEGNSDISVEEIATLLLLLLLLSFSPVNDEDSKIVVAKGLISLV